MKKILFVSFSLLLCAVFTVPAFSQDGAALYKSKGCVTCHGANGNKTLLPTYPILAGQNKEYIVQQLKEIKSGKRTGGLVPVMKPFASSLKESEMKAIAEFLSKQK